MLQLLPPPDHLVTRATDYVRFVSLASARQFVGAGSRRALELTAPHRVYALGFDAVAGRSLEAAQLIGWRFLVVREDEVIAATEVGHDEPNSVTVDLGPSAVASAEAFDRVEDLRDLTEDEFELRFLKVNALHLLAIWVAGAAPRVVPLDPAPWFVEAGRLYTEAEFFDALNQPRVQPFQGSRGQPPTATTPARG